jgi:flagellar basal-body rod modification protein FlgD
MSTSTTDPIAALAAQTQAALAAAQAKKSQQNLGIDEFLTLMTTQLKNQDPLKPLDGTAFIAQLAQFGTVSGIEEMKSSMESLAESLRSTQLMNGTALVGRDVLVPSEGFKHTEGVSVSGELFVPEGTADIELRITDSAGAVVRTMTMPTTPGQASFTWNGLKNDGTPAASGEYEVEVVANVAGQNESLPTAINTRVTSVTVDASGAGLVLNTPALGPISMADVYRVM